VKAFEDDQEEERAAARGADKVESWMGCDRLMSGCLGKAVGEAGEAGEAGRRRTKNE
jgi:hypothetical protein